ncbi:Sodium/solute symporter superfamily [Sesbania bispinosa]|nr:Sodium/solute symporter superfamily [Sesbania bispinosa]
MYFSLVSHTISSFAVIASLLNELCIQNSELGRLALSSALVSDVLSTFVASVGVALQCFWIIKRTPEGRPVKDGYIYVIIAMVFGLGFVACVEDRFFPGLFIINGFDHCFDSPFYSLGQNNSMLSTSLFCNMPTTDALSVALILNTKGVVEIGLYCALYDSNLISGQLYGLMMISVVVIACIVQWSVKFLYDPSRKYASYHRRNIMSLRPHSELRILVSIHKPNHIAPMIDFLDLCYPTAEHPITVDVVHLIELVGRALPLFIPHCLQRQVSGSQRSYSDDVILAFNIFEHDNQHAATINTYTAISPTHLMYEDVCHLALDKVASIIILPFHQRWSSDGAVLSDDKNIKTLNRKVLEIAPCSVGILVVRGSQSSTIGSTTRLAIIYLGGEDDEEVLCLTKRATRNPEIDIVIYHLICKDYIAELEDLMVAVMMLLQDVKNAHNVSWRRHGINSPQTDGLTHWSEFPELGVIGDFLSSPDFKSHASILVVQQQLARKARRQGWKF